MDEEPTLDPSADELQPTALTPTTGELPTGELPTGELPTGELPTSAIVPSSSGGGDSPPGTVPPDDAAAGSTGPGDEPPDGGDVTDDERPRRLRRDVDRRILGGVAAGLADYLGVDVVIIRVAFVLLTIFGGSGALIYLAAWLLIAAGDEEHPLAQQWARRRPPRRNLVLIILGGVLGLIALSDLFSSGPWWPHRDGHVGLVLGFVAFGLAVAVLAGSGGNRTAGSRLRWLLTMLVLAMVAVFVVVAATVFSIEAASGVPLRGGIGDTQWHPTSVSQVVPVYRLAMGNLNVDLTAVPFRTGTTHITASVGVGRVIVQVPPGPTVSVVAHSGLGDVQVFGRNNGGLSTVQTMQVGGSGGLVRARLVIEADAGVGQVQVVRATSVPAFPSAPAFS